MNNGRIWCVVNPTVGLPLFLGSVAGIALTVHFAVLNNTTWFSGYWNGSAPAKASLDGSTVPVAGVAGSQPAFVVNVTPTTSGTGSAAFVVSVTPRAEGQVVANAATDTR